jgi:DNA modification methylase
MTYEILQGDSLELVKKIENKRYQMIFLDPPFFDWTQEVGGNKPSHVVLEIQAHRLLKDNGTVFLCGTVPQLVDDWMFWKPYFNLVFEIIQNKGTPMPPDNMHRVLRKHENIWCLVKKDAEMNKTKLDISRASEAAEKGIEVEDLRQFEKVTGLRIKNIEEHKKWAREVGYPTSVFTTPVITKGHKEYVGHPTQKPRKLIKQIIQMSTEEGDWILDMFGGSGTVIVEAIDLKRNCTIMEINPEYVEMIRKRVATNLQLNRLTDYIGAEVKV